MAGTPDNRDPGQARQDWTNFQYPDEVEVDGVYRTVLEDGWIRTRFDGEELFVDATGKNDGEVIIVDALGNRRLGIEDLVPKEAQRRLDSTTGEIIEPEYGVEIKLRAYVKLISLNELKE